MLAIGFPSNSITISPGQIQHDQQETQELPNHKMGKPSEMSNIHFFQNQNIKTQETHGWVS
jgi:hypothetical protein